MYHISFKLTSASEALHIKISDSFVAQRFLDLIVKLYEDGDIYWFDFFPDFEVSK